MNKIDNNEVEYDEDEEFELIMKMSKLLEWRNYIYNNLFKIYFIH